MRYMLSLFDEKENVCQHIYVFQKVAEGATIGWGKDTTEPDGTRKWKVLSCQENRYGL